MPETKARQQIDAKLAQAGWQVQDLKQLNLGAATGVAVREYPTDTGPADYVMFVNREPVGVIEAKPDSAILTFAEDQTARYAHSALKWRVKATPLPFLFESTGQITRFTDARDPAPRSRELFHFFRPETLAEWLAQPQSLRRRLRHDLPELPTRNLRECQVKAVTGLEASLAHNKPRALVQMATGAGKTFTAITAVYRLLKFGGAKRILFLVDTRNLGKQAQQEFQAYTPPDDGRKFTKLYNVQRLASNAIDPHAQVCISTIQRMYSILSGEAIDDSAEDISLHELRQTEQQAKLVAYNPAIPVESFDFIVIDECHRSIYNLWKQVLDYYDAFLIGLTATPDKRTFGFFNENVVAEYRYEQSVADGVNVGYDVYEIETEISRKGAEIKAAEWLDHRDRLTRKKRWTQLDEDTLYSARELDRSVVNLSQIRQVIQQMKRAVEQELFPARQEVPKTLIFAKTDSHADDIIQIVREVYGQGNAFCKKVTYNSDEDTDSILASFRNDYNPRIAVTVDMIATGTDVKPLEVLLFMRDVRSKNYYEQMKGRGVRSLSFDDLKRVSNSADSAKTRFVLIDAVERILVKDDRAAGVALNNGEELTARVVISNAEPQRTFLQMIEAQHLAPEFLAAIKAYKCTGSVVKINLALGGLPNFTAFPNKSDKEVNLPHRTTMHVCPSIEYVDRAWEDAKQGRLSKHPMLEITIPSAYDDSLAPPGKHVMNIFAQYAPYQLAEGEWTNALKDQFADRCLDALAEVAPNIKNIIEHRQVISPRDMETEYGLTGGNIFHGDMGLDQLFSMRPLAGWADYRTPIRGLYLCGSGTHPGGGVMGAPGYNAAREILKDGR